MHPHSALLCLPVVAGSLALTSCAGPLAPLVIDGVAVQRLTMEYKGRPYSIRHSGAHPRPGSPSDGTRAEGGTIAGTVCGSDIHYQVTHNGDHVRVSGFINNEQSATLEIREANNIRRIQGGLGNFIVDVVMTGDTIAGTVGRCGYELHPAEATPDTFAQVLRTQGFNITMRVTGRQELRKLPAADQAALVPLMLYCATAKVFENFGHDPPELGFGGAEGAQPPKTINFGPQGNRSCGG